MKARPILFSTPMVQAILEGNKTQTRRTVGLDKINENPEDWELQHISRYNCLKPEQCAAFYNTKTEEVVHIMLPYGYGDRGNYLLWVREAWKFTGVDIDGEHTVEYKDGGGIGFYPDGEREDYWIEKVEKLVDVMSSKPSFKADDEEERCTWYRSDVPWKPSIHMPKDVCRIFLNIKDIRVERLHDISESDSDAEGVDRKEFPRGIYYLDYHNDKNNPWIFKRAYLSFITLWHRINGSESWNSNPWVWVVEFEQIEKPANWPNI